jgi:hypothetical protein
VKAHRPLHFLFILTSISMFVSQQALAETSRSEMDRWTPTMGMAVGLDIQKVSGSSVTSLVQPEALSTAVQNLRPSTDGDSLITGPTLGAELGLTSPRIRDDAGSPRFFIHGNIEAFLATDNIPNSEGSRGAIREPRDGFGVPLGSYQETSILGQGTRGKVEFDTLQFRAGAGMTFTFDLDGRRLQVKPSLEYIRKRAEPTAGLSRAIQTDQPLPPSTLMTSLDQARYAVIDVSMTQTLHGLGPGLELELDTHRVGPFIMTVFSGIKVYHFLGDLDDEATGSSGTSDPAFPPETATFRFEYDEWVTRVDAGVRLRWQPE